MAKRPVFIATESAPFFREYNVTFEYAAGFSKTQKQKNIVAMHNAFTRATKKTVLEISSKSTDEKGVALSAFNLKKYVPSLGRSVPVECIFQGGKVFENGGPYTDLLEKTPKEAKKDERLRNSGSLIAFEFEGKRFPLNPTTYFYDWVYMNALLENPKLAEYLQNFDAFTDVEFNPGKSLNCQARTCAEYVGIARTGRLDEVKEADRFLNFVQK